MKKSLRDSIMAFIAFIYFDLIKKGALKFLPDKFFILFEFFVVHRRLPNLKNPKTLSEKLQWIKLYRGLEKYTKYVDKLKVRNFIRKTIGSKYLVPLIGVWEKFEDIPFDKLPRRFVLKATHGSAYVFVCKDKSLLNKNALRKTVTKWMQESFYQKTREIQYKGCKPMIICEERLEDAFGDLTEYKFFCFDGNPYLVEVILNGYENHVGGVYKDLNWKTLNMSYAGDSPPRKNLIKPDSFKEMLGISEKLSNGFPFVRVDLYSTNNKVYFGELTFTPANGLERFDPTEVDYQLGKLIDLSKYNP